MHHLGQTRSAHRSRSSAADAGYIRARAVAGDAKSDRDRSRAPAAGARFTQYTAEFESGGRWKPGADTTIRLCARRASCSRRARTLRAGDYAYLPADGDGRLSAASLGARRRYREAISVAGRRAVARLHSPAARRASRHSR